MPVNLLLCARRRTHGGGGAERYGNGDQGQWDVALEALMARSALTSA